MMMKSNHTYHLVDMSPWPIITALSAMIMVVGITKWFYTFNNTLFLLGLMTVMISSYQWWRDITREATLQGIHTKKVINGLRWGMILFIISEVLFFFSFFWAFFHNSLSPNLEVGMIWPPTWIVPFNATHVPLLNTLILLSSGVTVTWAHHAIMENSHSQASQSLILTIVLGIYFTMLQALEYIEASFTLADSSYGCTFFVATGFHGLHVLIGTTFLLMTWMRIFAGHFSNYHHFGFEAAAWYWHFVDVVWLFLYLNIYWWGS